MWLDEFCAPLRASVCRHIPDRSPYDVLDPRFATASPDNRWNRQGEPTLYVGSDHDVLAVEWARHFPQDASAEIGRNSHLRRIYDMAVDLELVLNLRDHELIRALTLVDVPTCFLSKDFCRSLAQRLRRETRAQGLLAPPMGLLDRPESWLLVLFVDRLSDSPSRYLTGITIDGAFGLWQ